MASLDDLIAQIPISQIAGQLGVDEQTAAAAVKSAIPTLVGGLQANAQDTSGAASLEKALGDHGDLLDGGVDVSSVDTNDGSKIVSNIFGTAQNQVISTLGSTSGGGSDLIKQLLPILAPIVLAYVAKQLAGGAASTSAPAPTQASASSGGLGDLLGGLLKGAANSGGGNLGSILGGVLGGNAGGALGDVLGGLLGGGKR